MPQPQGSPSLEAKLIELLAGVGVEAKPAQVLTTVLDMIWRGAGPLRDIEDVAPRLAAMTEWDRHRTVATSFADAPANERLSCFWILGNELARRGYYAAAGATFLQAALTETDDAVTRAALLAKAALAGNTGSPGRGVPRWLVNASTILDRSDRSHGLAARLTRFMLRYTESRDLLFLDAYDAAEQALDAAVMGLGEEAAREIGVDASRIPDVLLLRARLARGRLEVIGKGSIEDIIRLLKEAEAQDVQPILLSASLAHHIAFQRAATFRLMREPGRAWEEATKASKMLTGVPPDRAKSDIERLGPPLNRRRLGYVLCLAGEILLEMKPSDIAVPLEYFAAARRVWMEPYYARGLARCCRLHAMALMHSMALKDERRRWTAASRLLRESIAHAQGSGSPAAEARAVACKIALHTILRQPQREDYERRLAEIEVAQAAYWPKPHLTLEHLRRGQPRPGPPLDEAMAELKRQAAVFGLWGDHPQFIVCLRSARQAASARFVLLTGENGTGKTQLARFIHSLRGRNRPFVPVSLVTLAQTVFESELFGHVRGAFTGAVRDKVGHIENAHGGTLFLDEVAEISLEQQTKLLQVLDDGQMRRVGDSKLIHVDFQLICATNRDLPAMVADGSFRQDLYYRITGTVIPIPPLRSRGRDIQTIGQRLLETEVAKTPGLNGRVKALTTSTWDELCGHPWPGNVRELQRLVEALTAALSAEDLTAHVNEAGVVDDDFVHRLIETLPAGRSIREASPERAAMDGDVLVRGINVTPRRFAAILSERSFRTKMQVAEYLKRISPGYDGDPESILKQISRVKAFKEILDRHFDR